MGSIGFEKSEEDMSKNIIIWTYDDAPYESFMLDNKTLKPAPSGEYIERKHYDALLAEIARLKAQIEAMLNCGNCKDEHSPGSNRPCCLCEDNSHWQPRTKSEEGGE